MKYRVTKKDCYRAYLLHIKPRRIYAILGIILICIALSVCLLPFLPIEDKPPIAFVILPLLGAVFVLLLIYVLPLYQLHKSFKQTKGASGEVELFIHEDSFSISDGNSNSTVPYQDIYKLRSDKDYLLIYINQYVYIVLAKTSNDLINATNTIEEKYNVLKKL